MGQKVNPVGIREGITRRCSSKWYEGKKGFAKKLLEDYQVRQLIEKNAKNAQVSNVQIERPANNAKITIFAAKQGNIIGQKGKGVETLRDEIAQIMGVPVNLNIVEVRKPELSAKLLAEQIASQLVQRAQFRRAMKRAASSALRAGAEGVKICVSGRLGGAEIARSEWNREGRVPLHTFRADIDYGLAEAHTTFGVIGVKVWICKGEKIGSAEQKPDTASEKKKS